jgi:hypothetical protein
VDPAYLANKLADALSRVAPPQVWVREQAGMLILDGGTWRVGVDVAAIVDEPGDPIDQVRSIVEETLPAMQTYASQLLGQGWPSASAVYRFNITEQDIDMWFEDASGNKVLEVPRIYW